MEEQERKDEKQPESTAARDAPNKQEEETLPEIYPYTWTSALSDHEKSELRFSGFEPCYIACIKDTEHQIKRKIQKLNFRTDNAGLTDEMTPLLLQYSQLVDALASIENRDRVFEEDYLRSDKKLDNYSGIRRRITRSKDSDRVHSHLRNNIFLVLIAFIYNWDLADNLKRRFGDLTATFDRILTAIAAGASLLVPMIMMTFLTTRTARLIIVSVATMLFAVALALTSTSREGVIGATAGYAAIMVVYIGSSEFMPGS